MSKLRGLMPAEQMKEVIARGDPCPSCGATWKAESLTSFRLDHRDRCALALYERLEDWGAWSEGPSDDPEYDRWCFETAADSGTYLPMSVNRLAASNECVNCRQAPDALHPATLYAGQGPDVENGPSPNDIPYVLHDGDCPTPGPLVEIVYCPTCGALDPCECGEVTA